MVKPSDKGARVVVKEPDLYERMCLDLMENTTWYKVISPLMIKVFNQQFYDLIERA